MDGPCADYAVPLIHNIDIPPATPTWGAGGNPLDATLETKEWNYYQLAPLSGAGPYMPPDVMVGPLRIAAFREASNVNTWMPRDTMAWWQDGSSNQLLMGEKCIPPQVLGMCNEADGPGTPAAGAGAAAGWHTADCSAIRSASYGVIRYARRILRTDFSTFPSTGNNWRYTGFHQRNGYGFGSIHPGMTHFVFGDGAVKGLATTTPETLLAHLACVYDGKSVSLE